MLLPFYILLFLLFFHDGTLLSVTFDAGQCKIKKSLIVSESNQISYSSIHCKWHFSFHTISLLLNLTNVKVRIQDTPPMLSLPMPYIILENHCLFQFNFSKYWGKWICTKAYGRVLPSVGHFLIMLHPISLTDTAHKHRDQT